MSETSVPIVIDAGTQEWRAGFANQNLPDFLLVPSLHNLEGVRLIHLPF